MSRRLSPEPAAVHASLSQNCTRKIVRPLRLLLIERRRACDPIVPLDRKTLCDRRAPRQHAVEIRLVPARRKMNPGVVVAVTFDQASQRGEGKVESIDRMREQQRVAL